MASIFISQTPNLVEWLDMRIGILIHLVYYRKDHSTGLDELLSGKVQAQILALMDEETVEVTKDSG